MKCCFFWRGVIAKKLEQKKTSALRNVPPVAPGPNLKGGVTANSSQGTEKTFQGVSLLPLCESVCGLLFTLRFMFFQFSGTVWCSQADKTTLTVLTCLDAVMRIYIECAEFCIAVEAFTLTVIKQHEEQIFKLWTVALTQAQ